MLALSPDQDYATLGCPLCRANILRTISLQKHLGRHLEEIALFALPQIISGSDLDSDSTQSQRSPDSAKESNEHRLDEFKREREDSMTPLRARR